MEGRAVQERELWRDSRSFALPSPTRPAGIRWGRTDSLNGLQRGWQRLLALLKQAW